MYLWSAKGVRILRFIGHGAAEDFGPICASEHASAMSSFLHRALEETPWRWDAFLGEHFVGNIDWSTALGATTLRRASSPVLRSDGDWSSFLKSRSANMRNQVTRFERRLKDKYRLRYRLADDPNRLPEDLDALFALHAARWGGRSSAFADREQFHRDFAARALERGWLRLWFLELDGRAVAAWYGFRFSGAQFAYQAGRDPSLDSLSVGTVLLIHTIRDALDEGALEYRFLRGGEAYKGRFATEDFGVETFGVAGGRIGRAMLSTVLALDRFTLLRGLVRELAS
jgi:CelD/BcsL family acetyltransferase involved in cellulose biosynthesis